MAKHASDEIEVLISELQLEKAGPALTLQILQQEISSTLARWQSMHNLIAKQLENNPSETKEAAILLDLRAENKSLQAKLAQSEAKRLEEETFTAESSRVHFLQPHDCLASLNPVPEVLLLPGTVGDANRLDAAAVGADATSDNKHAENNIIQVEKMQRLDTLCKRDAVRDSSARKSSRSVFPDEEALKQQLKDALRKEEYSVVGYYHESGWCQKIVQTQTFEFVTLAVIFINACWIWIDTDFNDADVLLHAEPQFIIAENLFCAFFTAEWLVRFAAFKSKWNCFRDAWFTFDSILLAGMVLETWILTIIFASLGREIHIFPTYGLRVVRLFRLTRMARMVRLLRATPELLVMVKAMAVALRSVFFTVCLLLCVVYVFAILFTQLLNGKAQSQDSIAYTHFRTVPQSMSTLLLKGALPDQADMIEAVGDDSFLHYLLMLAYMFLASLTVMNMLVGVLCEVISVVSNVESEEMLLESVKDKLGKILADSKIDADESGTINKAEFKELLKIKKFSRTLADLSVDVVGLVDLVDYIFEQGAELSFDDFMEVIADLRGTKTATVKDVVALRNLVMRQMSYLTVRLDEIQRAQ